jgi:hypothetical protein
LVARHGFPMPPTVMPPNQGLRGAARVNFARRVSRAGSLEHQADAILEAAGHHPWCVRSPGEGE